MTQPLTFICPLSCPHCGQSGALTWVRDSQGGIQARLPEGYHAETRLGLGRVVICDTCDEIMPDPD
jgi:hypothetical protein